MGPVRLGKILLRWCDQCNLPILEVKRCSCGASTRTVNLTPPGDARPAFAHDVDLVRRTVDRQFGAGAGKVLIPDGKIVLLNKVPALDRMNEVIVDGEVVGSLRYDLGKGWVFISRMPAAQAIQDAIIKNFVVSDEGAVDSILRSSNLLGPGVSDADDQIQPSEEVIVLDKDGRAIATGTARMAGSKMKLGERGVAVKVRWSAPPSMAARKVDYRSWEEVVAANQALIDERVGEAISFIHEVMKAHPIPTIISFSGGKDSLACLLLTLKAGLRLPIFFIDTGLEFKETISYVFETAKRHDLSLIVESAPDRGFKDGFSTFGPPGKDYRWCCKTNKLGPTVKAIMKHFPQGVLSFIGQRRYESEGRAARPRVWNNPWTPGQIGASPIQNWTALHVWLFIFAEKEPFNPWYELGLDRIGCYLCPACDLGELKTVEESCSQLRDWEAELREYAASRGLASSWVDLGMWRWKRPPASIKQEVERLGVKLKVDQSSLPEERLEGGLSLKMQGGASPCTMGVSIEGAFSHPLHLSRVANILNQVGKVELNQEEGWCSVNDVTIFEEGALIAKGKNEQELRKKVERVRRAVVKAEECVGCGVCIARCSEGALILRQERIQIDERCVHCGRCSDPCPAVTFGDSAFEL